MAVLIGSVLLIISAVLFLYAVNGLINPVWSLTHLGLRAELYIIFALSLLIIAGITLTDTSVQSGEQTNATPQTKTGLLNSQQAGLKQLT